MHITYTWKVIGLKTDKVHGSSNVIVQTHWKKIGTDEKGNQGEFLGSTTFSPDTIPKGTKFESFDNLKEEDVIKWIQASVIDLYEEHVNAHISRQIQEKNAVEVELPWKYNTNS